MEKLDEVEGMFFQRMNMTKEQKKIHRRKMKEAEVDELANMNGWGDLD